MLLPCPLFWLHFSTRYHPMSRFRCVVFANMRIFAPQFFIQIATLLCAPISLIALVLSLCSSIAISLSGFWAQRLLSPTAYIVLINSCKIPAVIISMLLGQDGCLICNHIYVFGFFLWTVGSTRLLYVSIEVDQRLLFADILLQFLKLLNALSAKKKCAIALTFVCIFALAQGFIGIARVTTITSTRSLPKSPQSLVFAKAVRVRSWAGSPHFDWVTR